MVILCLLHLCSVAISGGVAAAYSFAQCKACGCSCYVRVKLGATASRGMGWLKTMDSLSRLRTTKGKEGCTIRRKHCGWTMLQAGMAAPAEIEHCFS